MNLPLFIGKRYVRAKHGSGASVTSFISIVSIMIGTAVLIIALSVMNGVTSEVKERILSMTAHAKLMGNFNLTLEDEDQKNQIDSYLSPFKDQIVAYAPFVEGQALIAQGNSYQGVKLKGVDPSLESLVTDSLKEKSDALVKLEKGSFSIIVGKQLADQLGLIIGSKITIIVPKTTISAAGILPRIKQFTVVDFFESGHYLFDTGMAFINQDDAKILFQKQSIDGYQIKLKDAYQAPKFREEANKTLPPPFFIFDWSQENSAYFNSVQAEKVMIFIILMCILVVAYINILSTLFMTVSEKKSDIAILRTLGVQAKEIIVIFMIQGVILGFIGTLLGFLVGYLVSDNMPVIMTAVHNLTGFSLPPELYFISELPAKMETKTISLILGSSFLLSILAPLYPAYKASKIHPARALAYE